MNYVEYLENMAKRSTLKQKKKTLLKQEKTKKLKLHLNWLT